MMLHTAAICPFQELAIDFAYVNDQNYLIMVYWLTDRLSIHLLQNDITAHAVNIVLRIYFARTIVADVVRLMESPKAS